MDAKYRRSIMVWKDGRVAEWSADDEQTFRLQCQKAYNIVMAGKYDLQDADETAKEAGQDAAHMQLLWQCCAA